MGAGIFQHLYSWLKVGAQHCLLLVEDCTNEARVDFFGCLSH